MAILSSKNGKPVWRFSVRDNDFGYSKKSSAVFEPGVTPNNEEFLMQRQHTDGPAPPYTVAHTAPHSNPQAVADNPPRPVGSLGHEYPTTVEV